MQRLIVALGSLAAFVVSALPATAHHARPDLYEGVLANANVIPR